MYDLGVYGPGTASGKTRVCIVSTKKGGNLLCTTVMYLTNWLIRFSVLVFH